MINLLEVLSNINAPYDLLIRTNNDNENSNKKYFIHLNKDTGENNYPSRWKTIYMGFFNIDELDLCINNALEEMYKDIQK